MLMLRAVSRMRQFPPLKLLLRQIPDSLSRMRALQQPYSNWHPSLPVDQVGVEERVARLNARSIKKQSKAGALLAVVRGSPDRAR